MAIFVALTYYFKYIKETCFHFFHLSYRFEYFLQYRQPLSTDYLIHPIKQYFGYLLKVYLKCSIDDLDQTPNAYLVAEANAKFKQVTGNIK